MANGAFNIAKGRVVEYYNRVKAQDPSGAEFSIMLLDANESESTLIDRDTFSALLAVTANVEATFTNYARIALDDTDLAALPAPDDTNDRRDLDIDDQVWSSAGNGTNNDLTKVIIGYDYLGTDVDANIVPCTHHDFSVTTDGSDLTAQVNASGFYRAA